MKEELLKELDEQIELASKLEFNIGLLEDTYGLKSVIFKNFDYDCKADSLSEEEKELYEKKLYDKIFCSFIEWFKNLLYDKNNLYKIASNSDIYLYSIISGCYEYENKYNGISEFNLYDYINLNEEEQVEFIKYLIDNKKISEVRLFENNLIEKLSDNYKACLITRDYFFEDKNIKNTCDKRAIIEFINSRDILEILNKNKDNKQNDIDDIFDISTFEELDEAEFSFSIFYKYRENITDEELNIILEKDLYEGIECYKKIVNNKDIIEKLIQKKYYRVLSVINDENFLEELINKYNLSNLTFEDIQPSIYKEIDSDKLFCLIYKNSNELCTMRQYLSSRLQEKRYLFYLIDNLKYYYKIQDETILDAINNGYKCNNKIKIDSINHLKLFIENGQPNILDYFDYKKTEKNNEQEELKKLIESAITKGYVVNANFIVENFFDTLNYCIENKNYLSIKKYYEIKPKETLEVISKYKKDKSYREYFNDIGLFDYFFIQAIKSGSLNFEKEDWNDENIFNKGSIIHFSKILKEIPYEKLSKFIDIDSIDEYFNDAGPTEKSFDTFLISNNDIFNCIFKDEYEDLYKKYYSNNPEILEYIKFSKKNYLILNEVIDNKDDIVLYFNEFGPKRNLFDKVLCSNWSSFSEIFREYEERYKECYKNDLDILNYIKVNLEKNKFDIVFRIKTIDDINKYFDKNGNFTKKVFDKKIFDREKFYLFFSKEYEKVYEECYKDSKEVLAYIDYITTSYNGYYGEASVSFINSIDDIYTYFNEEGPKKILFDLSLFDFNLFSNNLFNNILNRKDKKYEKLYEECYKDSKEILSYIDFTKYLKNKNNDVSVISFIKSIDDIDSYFNEEGPKKNLFDLSLFDSDLFDVTFLREDKKYEELYEKYYKNSKEILSYINLIKENSRYGSNWLINIVESIDNINAYFNEFGPTKNLFDMCLLNYELFNIIFNDKDSKYEKIYKEYYNDSKEILNYIDLVKSFNGYYNDLRKVLCIKELDDINTYFNEDGLTKEFIDSSLLNYRLLVNVFKREDKKYEKFYLKYYGNDLCIRNYINYIIDYNFMKNIVEELQSLEDIYKWFSPNGVTKVLANILFERKLFKAILESKGYFYDNVFDTKQTIFLNCYSSIKKDSLKQKYVNFLFNIDENTNSNKYSIYDEKIIEEIFVIFEKIENSNSIEMRQKCDAFTELLINNYSTVEEMNKNLHKIEKIFLENNLPYVAKVYNVFKILYPNYNGLHIDSDKMSPVIKNAKSNEQRDVIIFSDLLKASIGSNNRSIKEYIKVIRTGDNIYKEITSGIKKYDQLSKEEELLLNKYVCYVKMLYSQTKKGKNESLEYTDNLIEDLKILEKNLNIKTDIKDKLVKYFLLNSNLNRLEDIENRSRVNSFDKLESFINNLCKKIDEKNRQAEEINDFNLSKGDYVKGIGSIEYLGYLLNNGSVAREFLGSSADSDATPLDADFSIILKDVDDNGEKLSIEQTIENTVTRSYGPIWLVLKNGDDRFSKTRRSPSEEPNVEVVENYEKNKYEMFYTGAIGIGEHYGLRTGFPTSEIDYFVTEIPFDTRIGLEIAMNGFYIPVVDKKGNLLFTSKMYDELRRKMAGLSYFEEYNYKISESAKTLEVENLSKELLNSKEITSKKREKLYELIDKALIEFSKEESIEPRIKLKNKIDGDLTPGSIEILDTGSTGRNTNVPNDGDFDLMMRVDQNLILDEEKLIRLKQKILDVIDPNGPKALVDGDIREYKAKINLDENTKTQIELDITFIVKSNNNGMNYPTEECVKDRLSTIEKNYSEEEYNLVIANVLLAKKLLKGANAYKPHRKDSNQGGMGGVGVENWILQNKGSLYEAAKSFMDVANSSSFGDFIEKYKVYDFGVNHMAEKKNIYPHDNFILNMNIVGYNKMKEILSLYIKFYEDEKTRDNAAELAIEIFKNKLFIWKFSYKDNDEVSAKEQITLDIFNIVNDKLKTNIEIKEASLGQTGFMYEFNYNGITYIVKPGINKSSTSDEYKVRPARVEIQVAASKAQQQLCPSSYVEVNSLGSGNVKIAIQEKISKVECNDLIGEHVSELLGEYVLDYLIGNFDSDSNNFIVDSNNKLRGIDKEQALKYLFIDEDGKSLDLNMNYHPEGTRGAIYSEIFKKIRNGEIDIETIDFIYFEKALYELNKLDIRSIFYEYAASYDDTKIDEIINKIEQRRTYFMEHIKDFINELYNNNILNKQIKTK